MVVSDRIPLKIDLNPLASNGKMKNQSPSPHFFVYYIKIKMFQNVQKLKTKWYKQKIHNFIWFNKSWMENVDQ